MTTHRLDQVSLGEVIRDLYLQRRTCRLQVAPEDDPPVAFAFRDGQLVQVLPEQPDHRWGQWLVQKHLVSPWDLELALTQVRPGHPIGQALTDLGLLSEEEVQTALAEWAFQLWQTALQYTRGTCTEQAAALDSPTPPVLTGDVGDWLARAIREFPDSFPFGQYLGATRFTVVREPGRKIPNVRLFKAEKMLLETLAEGRSLTEVAQLYHMPAKTVERAAYLFRVLNWLEPAADQAEAATDDLEIYEKILTTTGIHELLNPTEVPTADEVKDLAARAAKLNFYELLGLEPNASSKEIVDAYYRVSHRYTPHLLAKIYGPDPELIQAAETLSEAIDRAYRMLRDPDKRRRYHENLGLPIEPLDDEPAIEHAKTAYKIYMNARKALLGGRYVEASRLLAKAVRMKPDQAMYWERLGDAYVRLRKYKEAVDAYQKAWQHQPYNLDVAVALARLYWQFQKPALAARWAREALKIDPDHPQIRKFLAQIEETKKGREKSGSLLERLRKKK